MSRGDGVARFGAAGGVRAWPPIRLHTPWSMRARRRGLTRGNVQSSTENPKFQINRS